MDDLFIQISELIQSARKVAVRNVNTLQVLTNYEIGRRIVLYEQKGATRADYGAKLLEELSERLSTKFGKGFSLTNLKLIRQFYLLYQHKPIGQTASDQLEGSQKSQTLSDQFKQSPLSFDIMPTSERMKPFIAHFSLSWSHYVFLIGIKSPEECSFYEIEAKEQDWSLRELKRQFNSGLYERLALSSDKEEIRQLAKKGQVITKPVNLLKEAYVLEFLGLDEKTKYSESDLETAIIDKLEQFLLELGKGFLFESRQKRFTFDEEHYYIDLVFYNRLLQCYVLIDLKIGKLTHQDLGQMQMYVNYFDRHVKMDHENKTVGMILCKKKNTALVEITLPEGANIHAKEYQLYLPDKELLKQKLLEWEASSQLGQVGE